MAKNSVEGNRKRAAAYRERQKKRKEETGIVQVSVKVPQSVRPALYRAAELIRQGVDPNEALRVAGGSNEEPLPDRQALQEMIGQLEKERDGLRETMRTQNEALSTQADTLAKLRPLAKTGKAAAALPGFRGWLVRRWLKVPQKPEK